MRNKLLEIKAFTLLESLIVLSLTTFLTISFFMVGHHNIERINQKLFFVQFGYFYRDTQQLSASYHKKVTLSIADHEIRNGYSILKIPKTVNPKSSYQVVFNNGGNSSLQKITFETKEGQVSYQLYIGSGQYKKSED